LKKDLTLWKWTWSIRAANGVMPGQKRIRRRRWRQCDAITKGVSAKT